MPSSDQRINSAVGNKPARNAVDDQIVILTLLASISPQNGGPTGPLPPPIAGGTADFRLVNAIFNFQRQMSSFGLMSRSKNDARVDPNGTTLRLMNKFAGFKGGGGGGQTPNRPPLPPPTTPPTQITKGRGFLQPLFSQLSPRPTNWKIAGTGSVSLSLAEFGVVNGFMSLSDARKPSPISLNMIGGGLSLGPIPFGVEIAPGSFPSLGSQIHAGPRTKTTTLELEELLGVCVLIGASGSPVPGGGGNASTFLFSVGSNRSLSTLKFDILNAVHPNAVIGFLNDSFHSCRAWGSTVGAFAGVSLGVSLMEVKLFKDNIF